jgi:hypothetical protein
VVKRALILVALLSSDAMAQYYGRSIGGVSPTCQFAWTADCEHQIMLQENLYREQMLQQTKRQNDLLQQQIKQNQGYHFDNSWTTLR